MSNVVPLAQRRPVRWVATCFYRSAEGVIDVDHGFDEIEDLQQIIERGPDWRTLDRIEIRLRQNSSPGLTIEQAKEM